MSWRAKGGGREHGEAIAVRFCYVDASNFNSVKSHLPVYAAVEVRRTLRIDERRSNVMHSKQTHCTDAAQYSSCFGVLFSRR